MNFTHARLCPICSGVSLSQKFPYATRFNGIDFSYLKCTECSTVFVDPIPDSKTFAKIYAKADYHDCYYEGKEGGEYLVSAQWLKQYLPAGASVLDYGCGVGGFLKALKQANFIPYGVEFDQDAAQVAGHNADCKVVSVDEFMKQSDKKKFDAIHIGDVLEHLPDPTGTLKMLFNYIKADGIFFIEGPLQRNPSLVYWASLLFGVIKRLLRPNSIGTYPPTHLFRTDAKQLKAFLSRVEPSLNLKSWSTYETGWPYVGGGLIKRTIAWFAISIGGRELFGLTFGNRYRGVFIFRFLPDGSVKPISL